MPASPAFAGASKWRDGSGAEPRRTFGVELHMWSHVEFAVRFLDAVAMDVVIVQPD